MRDTADLEDAPFWDVTLRHTRGTLQGRARAVTARILVAAGCSTQLVTATCVGRAIPVWGWHRCRNTPAGHVRFWRTMCANLLLNDLGRCTLSRGRNGTVTVQGTEAATWPNEGTTGLARAG